MEGPWIKAPKTPESTDRPGKSLTLIHDDDVAKSLGYQGGFTIMAITSPAIFASFGHKSRHLISNLGDIENKP